MVLFKNCTFSHSYINVNPLTLDSFDHCRISKVLSQKWVLNYSDGKLSIRKLNSLIVNTKGSSGEFMQNITVGPNATHFLSLLIALINH